MQVNGKNFKKYYVQETTVNDVFKHSDRLEFLIPLIKDKIVLHVGFVDWPVTDVNASLHIELSKHAKQIDGIDANMDHAEKLRVANGEIYYNWHNVPNNYDVILIPEVLEHVGNVQEFLNLVDSKKGTLIFTTPDAFLLQVRTEYINGNFLEVVHPDHNCYYTPFTLKNTIEKYTSRKVESLHWIHSQSVAAICR
jgi:hypothetical protein